MSRLSQKEIELWSNTNETTPLHIWKHNAWELASKHGAKGDYADALNPRLVRAYHAGEPVWMFAMELIHSCTELAARERADRMNLTPSRAIAAGICLGIKRSE